ncbi:MAG: hypothetical protein R3C10_18380 [Pirellulales bacterium]
MRSNHGPRRTTRLALAAAMLAGTAFTTGCQVDMGGQTLPSAFYLQDDFQYFPPGPEFKLSNEAAHMQQMEQEQAAQVR